MPTIKRNYTEIRRQALAKTQAINRVQRTVKKREDSKAVEQSQPAPIIIKKEEPTKPPRLNRYQKIRRGVLSNLIKPEQYNQKHKGKRGFVIGGGSSIKSLQERGFDFTKLTSEISVGVNKSYELFVPTYLVFGDAYFWRKFSKEIEQVDCTKIAPMNILGGSGKAKQISNLLPIKRTANSQQNLPTSFGNPICFVNNSGVAALRIAYLLGLNPIYLVGMDIGPDPVTEETHFHNAYKSDSNRTTRPQRYVQFQNSFKETIKQCAKVGVKVYSCSPFSPLNSSAPYVDLTTLFQE